MDNNQTVLLRVQIDEGKTEERLAQLANSLAKTRDEQKALTKAREQSLVSEEAFGKESVKLANQLTLQRGEQGRLTKDLQLYRDANEGVGTSYKNLQSALSLAQRQFQVLEGSADNGTEAAQILSKTIEDLRVRLRATDETQQNFARNIGNYPKNDALEKLIQQLVTLQEQEKRVTVGSEEALKVRNQIGYVQQAAIQRGAQEGKAYEETTSFIKQYSEAIRPATTELLHLTEQQQHLAATSSESTEEIQKIGFQIGALAKQIKDTPTELPPIKVPTGSLEELAAGLVKIREQQKGVATDSAAFEQAEREIKAYEAAAIAAGAEAGLSYEQAQQKLIKYSAQIQPLVANLVKLEAEQAQVGEGSEAFTQIGVKITQASKQIQAMPGDVKGVKDTLVDLDSTTGAFGGQVANLKQQFTQAKQGIELARVGFTGLKGAIAATGIGVLILALGALYEYFTKTDEGAEDLAAGLAYLKGLFSVLESVAISAGKGVALVFKDPLEAGKELVDFIETNLLNRVKSFGVLWEAIKNGDSTKLVDSAVQFVSGITDATAKSKELTAEMKRTGDAAYAISRATDQLEDHQRESLNLIEKNKNAAAQLLLSSKDLTLSDAQRLANLDKASQIEKVNLEITTRLAKEKLAIAKATNDEAERTGKTDDTLRDAVAQAEADVTRLVGESASFQQTVQNRRSHLLQDEATDVATAATKAKAAAEKEAERRVQLRKSALEMETALLDRQLKTVQLNSDEELHILQQKLRNGYEAELNVKHLTVAAKQAADAKYESETLALTLDFNRRKLIAGLQAQADLTAAALAGQQAGSEEAQRLQAQQIEQQRKLTLAGLQANADNTAAIAKTNAQAAQQQRQLEYQQVAQALTEDIEHRKQLVENAHAAGLIKEREYQEKLAELTKIGTDTQTLINKDYLQDNSANQKQATANETAAITRHTADVKKGEETKQEIREATVQAFEQGTDTIISLFGEESAAGQAAVALKKVLALAEIGINLEKQLRLNAIAAAEIKTIPIIGPALGIAYEIAEDALAIAGAAASTAKILSFEQGGVAVGPSHTQGGIPLYYRGRPAGIEIEGGEPVLTRNVSRSPLLLSMASSINQLAGGRPLSPTMTRNPFLALGGLSHSVALQQLRGPAAPEIDYQKLGNVLADSLRRSPSVNVWSHFEAAQQKAKFTQSLAST